VRYGIPDLWPDTARRRTSQQLSPTASRAPVRTRCAAGEAATATQPGRRWRARRGCAGRSRSGRRWPSRAKHLALDSAAWGADVDQLAAQLQDTARLLRQRPASDTARLPALHAEVTRLQAQVGDAGQRLDSIREQHDQLRRRDPQRQVLADRIDRQTGALGRLEEQLTGVRATVAAAEQRTTPRDAWDAAHTEPLERAVSAGRELGWRHRAEQRAVQAVAPEAVTVELPPVVVESPGIALQRR